MLEGSGDLGAALFKTWTEKERINEIAKLVSGFRNGVPVGILCKMAETIAGNRKLAKKYLKKYMTEAERIAAVESAPDAVRPIAKTMLI